ncbi:MAG: C1 family peptidase, partial [Chthoniobacteraceae bacterium]
FIIRSVIFRCIAGFLWLFAQLPMSAFAQDLPTGAILVPKRLYSSLPKANAPPGAALGEPVVTLRPDFPPPGNQGLRLQSCTAFAVAYAVETYLQKKESGWKDFSDQHISSPSFIYNQFANNHGSRGIYIRQALNIVESGGSVSLATMPYDPNDADTGPSEQMINDAAVSKLNIRTDPLKVFDVDTVKSYLVSQIPIVVGAKVDTANQGQWEKNSKGVTDGYLPSGHLGSHCMVVIGYDDSKEAFEILNSWGSAWNDNGYGWISYKFWPDWANEAYTVQLTGKADLPPAANVTASQLKAIPIGPEGRSNGNWGYPAGMALSELRTTIDKKLSPEVKKFFPANYRPGQ